MQEPMKVAADAASLGTVVATLAGWLPPIAALFSIIWCAIQIYEWWRNRHADKDRL